MTSKVDTAAQELTAAIEKYVTAVVESHVSDSKESAANDNSAPTKGKGKQQEESTPAPSGDTYTKSYLQSLTIKELRALGKEHDVASKYKNDIIAALKGQPVNGSESSDEEEDEEPEEVDEEEEEEYTRSELEEMTLKQVRAVAKEAGIETKGVDQSDLIDSILGEESEEEEEGEESEEGESEEEVEVTEEELQEMTSKELTQLHEDHGLELPDTKGMNKSGKHDALVKSILANASDEEEDEEEED